jgi:hypothetical protein
MKNIMNISKNDISNDDEMFVGGNLDHYFKVGKSAIGIINQAVLQFMKASPPETILDIPCGHGRVTRWLRDSYPNAKISVSDLNFSGAIYCAEKFNCIPLKSNENFKLLNFGKFDLIWVGSLITHLNKELIIDFLDFCNRHINDNGLVIISSHGSFVSGYMRALLSVQPNIENIYGLNRNDVFSILDNFDKTGFGYAPYPNNKNYGISLLSQDMINSMLESIDLKILKYTEKVWDFHHDIFILSKI